MFGIENICFRQKAQAHYQKLHAEGKTEQARADLARLAIIRQQREEAKKRREAEIKGKYTFIGRGWQVEELHTPHQIYI